MQFIENMNQHHLIDIGTPRLPQEIENLRFQEETERINFQRKEEMRRIANGHEEEMRRIFHESEEQNRIHEEEMIRIFQEYEEHEQNHHEKEMRRINQNFQLALLRLESPSLNNNIFSQPNNEEVIKN